MSHPSDKVATRSKDYAVEGTPVPYTRAKAANAHYYQNNVRLNDWWRLAIENQHGDDGFFCGPLALEVRFFFDLTDRKPKREEQELQAFRPDIHDLVKFILDCCLNIVCKDISQFSTVTAIKRYSRYPRTEFTIREIIQKEMK